MIAFQATAFQKTAFQTVFTAQPRPVSKTITGGGGTIIYDSWEKLFLGTRDYGKRDSEMVLMMALFVLAEDEECHRC